MKGKTHMDVREKRILLIDDDEEFSGDLCFLLSGPYQFVSVSESKRGMELMKKERFDAVILDLNMPAFFAEEDEMEGIEVLRVIRKRWGVRIPVIILSKMATPENRSICFDLGADAFFSKPPDIRSLRKRVEELLRKGTLEEKL